MRSKKIKSKKGDSGSSGIYTTISSQDFSVHEKEDNHLWWSLGLFLFMICIGGIWFATTF